MKYVFGWKTLAEDENSRCRHRGDDGHGHGQGEAHPFPHCHVSWKYILYAVALKLIYILYDCLLKKTGEEDEQKYKKRSHTSHNTCASNELVEMEEVEERGFVE